MYDNLLDHGGLCDPSPGHTAYRARVDASKIHSSGMKLSVVRNWPQSGLNLASIDLILKHSNDLKLMT